MNDSMDSRRGGRLSRRHLMMMLGGLAAAASTLSASSAAAALAARRNRRRGQAIVPPAALRLTTSADPGFKAAIDAWFPGLSANRRFARHATYLALVRNVSNDQTLGYTLTWTSTNQGKVQEHYRRRVLSARQTSVAARKSRANSAPATLAPGGVALVSPMFTWTPETYRQAFPAGATGRNPLGPKRMQRTQAKRPRAFGFMKRSRHHAVSVRLTGALMLGDGAQGSRGRHLARVQRNRRNASHDEAIALLAQARVNGRVDTQRLLRGIDRSLQIAKFKHKSRHPNYVTAREKFALKLKWAIGRGQSDRALRLLQQASGRSRAV